MFKAVPFIITDLLRSPSALQGSSPEGQPWRDVMHEQLIKATPANIAKVQVQTARVLFLKNPEKSLTIPVVIEPGKSFFQVF